MRAPKARVLPLDDTPTEEIDDFRLKIDGLVKSQEFPFGVIPAKAGIQFFQ
jgi:hypothetical protein